ncbi:MAG TPA: AI-2E family transporter [Actinomycetota bacterium]|nr:AI-2E family transporter [Actinomycetota bacterium]
MTAAPRDERRWPPVSYWMKATAGVLVVLALARGVIAVANVLVLVVIAAVLAIGFEPAVRFLQGRGFRRGWAVASIFLAGTLVVAGFVAVVLPIIVREIADLVREAPGFFRRAQHESDLVRRLEEQFDLSNRLRSLGTQLPATALALVRSVTALVFNSITVAILTIYFMVAMPSLRRGIARMLDRDDREDFESILETSTQRVGGYVLGNIAVSIVAGVVSFIALLVIGIPYAAALAFWVALTDLVPTIGAILGMLAAGLVAAFVGPVELVATLAFFLVYQQIENYVIAPRVMRKAIDMSPAAVIVAVLIGGTLAGVVGALLALPVAAIAKVAVTELYLRDRIDAVDAAEG